jgi:hypothetical protein
MEPLFLPWYGPCEYIFVLFTFYFVLFLWDLFCSRSEREKRNTIWDACVAEINRDPGQKEDLDTQMLAVMDAIGQYNIHKQRVRVNKQIQHSRSTIPGWNLAGLMLGQASAVIAD